MNVLGIREGRQVVVRAIRQRQGARRRFVAHTAEGLAREALWGDKYAEQVECAST